MTACAAALMGCGGSEPATTTREAVKPARSEKDCVAVWNADARPGTAGQQAPVDFLIELAKDGRTRSLVIYIGTTCEVVAPIGNADHEAFRFVAGRGRGQFSAPERFDVDEVLGKGKRLRTNADIGPDGRLTLD